MVREVQAAGRDTRLTERFARRLAVWATYEDAIRVADLKTRRARFERIRAEQGAPAGATLVVTDYLKPDLDEIYGILPAAIGRPIARWAERRWPAERPTLGQHVRTTTVVGFLRVWLLGRLRFLRPRSLRFRARVGPHRALARRRCWTAPPSTPSSPSRWRRRPRIVRGYGEVRRRLCRRLRAGSSTRSSAPAVARDRDAGAGFARSRGIVAEARRLLLADEKGDRRRGGPGRRRAPEEPMADNVRSSARDSSPPSPWTRPDRRNSLSDEMLTDLVAALRRAARRRLHPGGRS